MGKYCELNRKYLKKKRLQEDNCRRKHTPQKTADVLELSKKEMNKSEETEQL